MLSVAVLVVVLGAGLHLGDGVVEAQRNGNPKPPPTLQNGPATLPSLEQPAVIGPDPIHAHMDEERMKAMNDDRHKKLAADVDRLLALSNELKSDVEKANKDELSVSVIRKAAEIEKLAHDVQSRMKN
jgi:outer membrane murein-binding lipoprotein Lpp